MVHMLGRVMVIGEMTYSKNVLSHLNQILHIPLLDVGILDKNIVCTRKVIWLLLKYDDDGAPCIFGLASVGGTCRGGNGHLSGHHLCTFFSSSIRYWRGSL